MDELFKELQNKGLMGKLSDGDNRGNSGATIPVWLLDTTKLDLNYFGLLYQFEGNYGRN